jgi:predicted ATP-grasp superfamily ATP-dependent carboligase
MSPGLDSLFRWSRQTLARYPSEAAWVDLVRETPERFPLEGASGFGLVIQAGARAAGVLLANPRLRGCTEILGARLGSN